MTRILCFSLIFALLIASISIAIAEGVQITGGVNCVDSVAVKANGKTVSTKALAKKMKKLRKKLRASSGKKASLRKKISKIRKLKKGVKKCNNGEYGGPAPQDPNVYIPDAVRSMVGTHTADYRRGTDKPVEGTLTVYISLANNILQVSCAFTGYIAETKNLPAVNFEVDYAKQNGLLSYTEALADTPLGMLPVEMIADGGFRVENAAGGENLQFGLRPERTGGSFVVGTILFGTSAAGTEELFYIYF